MNYRMLGPATAVTTIANGRSYSGSPGAVYDVPDADADVLGANGWTKICPSGPTSERPPTAQTGGYWAAQGSRFSDTTLALYVVFDSETWRDPATGNAV